MFFDRLSMMLCVVFWVLFIDVSRIVVSKIVRIVFGFIVFFWCWFLCGVECVLVVVL